MHAAVSSRRPIATPSNLGPPHRANPAPRGGSECDEGAACRALMVELGGIQAVERRRGVEGALRRPEMVEVGGTETSERRRPA